MNKKERKIIVESPTRVDIAGGTLDLWPLYSFLEGTSITVNVAINIYSRVEILPLGTEEVILESLDLKKYKKYSSFKDFLGDPDPSWNLLKVPLAYKLKEGGFHLKTASQSPVGGGLGGSSSMMISILKALSAWQGEAVDNVHSMVHLAHNLEAKILRTPTGTQDYYPAVNGGLNFLEYSEVGITQKVLTVSETPLSTHFVLVYSGKSHHSGINNFEVMKGAVAGDEKVLKSLAQLQQISLEMKQVLLNRDWHLIPILFEREYRARIELCPEFSSDEIKRLHALSHKVGAGGLKICGAGGGGCVLIWCSPERQEFLKKSVESEGFRVLDAIPVDPF